MHRLRFVPAIALLVVYPAADAQHRSVATFVTTLGRDTVAIETWERRTFRLNGEFVLRVPTAVRFKYAIDLRADGSLSRSRTELIPLRGDRTHWVVVTERQGDSTRVTFDSAGARRVVTRATSALLVPSLTTGFESSFGIYSSIAMLQLALDRMPPTASDTVAMPTIGVLSGRATARKLVRRSSTEVDVDYFGIAWTHVTMDAQGLIERVDATNTTEKTLAFRTTGIDISRVAREYASRDAAGRGIGVASPLDSAAATIGGTNVFIRYSSPRRRGRHILGETVPYDSVWRTGANAATVLHLERDLFVGDALVRRGTYSVWTRPTRGGVTLILNRQHGQWGTEYDSTRDVAHIAMFVTPATTEQEQFNIALVAERDTGTLRVSWDDFVWSVPLRAR